MTNPYESPEPIEQEPTPKVSVDGKDTKPNWKAFIAGLLTTSVCGGVLLFAEIRVAFVEANEPMKYTSAFLYLGAGIGVVLIFFSGVIWKPDQRQ